MKKIFKDIIKRIRKEIHTQDNLATADPVYCVQQKRRQYGMDPVYADDNQIVWVHCEDYDYEAEGEEFDDLETLYDETLEEPEEWTRTAFVDHWEFVTCFFTRVAADDYIRANKHNMKEPRVYVESAYRNYEWQAVRAMFLEAGVSNN